MSKKLLQGLLFGGLLAATAYDAKAEVTSDYFIHFQPKQQAGMLVHDDAVRQWASMWVGHKEGFVEWIDPNKGTGSGREYELVRAGWLVITAFDQWSATCTKAILEDINSGQRSELQCSTGHFYIPWLVTKDPIRVRV